MKVIFACVLVLVVLLQTADAIKCYTCFGDSCSDTTDCDGSCMKTVASAGSSQGVVRGCNPISSNDGCRQQSVAGASAEICFCNTDRCNDATGAALSLPLLGMTYLLNRLF